jgi:hypothetical protein
MSVILATWETEIERITVQSQPGQIVLKTPSPKTEQMDRRCASRGRIPAFLM